jgi:uncharacterized protein (TIGR00299 family) protein
MLLGALLDAGVALDALQVELTKLDIGGYELRADKARRAGLAATQADVALDQSAAQPHRRLNDILALLKASRLPAVDKKKGLLVFRRLAEAEAGVHGATPETVDFHEVGAVDALVDVMGTVAGLRLLGVDELYCSALPAGGGTVEGSHGLLPVPAPAALELLARAGAPLAEAAGEDVELVTPTGAAIVTSLARFERPAMRVSCVGYGAGRRDPAGRPNVLRLWLGEKLAAGRAATLLLETNIDDMNPELFPYVQERLFGAGAADVWFVPIQMKKNRPGTLLSVLCPREREDAVVRLLLHETSTLGVRVSEVRRHEARRENLTFESSLGPAAVKVKRLEDEPPRVSPEYEDCRRLARKTGLPLEEVYRLVAREALEHLSATAEEDAV